MKAAHTVEIPVIGMGGINHRGRRSGVYAGGRQPQWKWHGELLGPVRDRENCGWVTALVPGESREANHGPDWKRLKPKVVFLPLINTDNTDRKK